MMTLWNYLSTLYINSKIGCKNMFYYIQNYFHGYHDTWLFIPGHTFPISLNNISNPIDIDWIYDNFDTTFTYSSDENDRLIPCKFSWLSAKIQIVDPRIPDEAIEYNIDDFIENFVVHTKSDTPPSLYLVFMCWCAHSKNWFTLDNKIQFHIIDDMGEEVIIDLRRHNNSIIIKRNRIYFVIDTEDPNNNVIQKYN